MLNKEIIQLIQSDYSKGVTSDDSKLSARLVYSKMQTVRNRLLVQEINKKQDISVWNYQTLSCVELVKVPLYDCPCVPPSGCTMLRSKHKLPKLNNSLYGESVRAVSTLGSQPLQQIDISMLDTLEGNKYTKRTLRYFFKDGDIYVISNAPLKVITLMGLFENPIEVLHFRNLCENCTDCNTCIDYRTIEFPLDPDLIAPLVQIITEDLLRKYLGVATDSRNNGQDDRVQQNGQ